MSKTTFCLIATLMAVNACISTPTPPGPPPSSFAPGPPSRELLEALSGRWRNEQDTAHIIEIRDAKMRHFQARQMTEECDLEAFTPCACLVDSTNVPSSGWCFTEKGASGPQCYHVLRCDSLLSYRAVSTTGAVFSFKKI